MIETSVASTDPADCTKLSTQQFLEQTNFTTGPEAVSDCEAEAANTEDDPDSVEVANIEVDGSAATADVTFAGSVFDGSTVTVALVQEGDQWKLDSLDDIQDFDIEGFRTAFTEQLGAEGDVPAPIADCISQAIAEVDEEQVKSALLSGDEAELTGLFGDCIPTG